MKTNNEFSDYPQHLNSEELRATRHDEQKRLETYGKSLVGKSAQSRLVKELSPCGQKSFIAPRAKIVGYEIVESFMEPTLMVTLSTGETVFEDTLFNISK
jgi:hypothetical protein